MLDAIVLILQFALAGKCLYMGSSNHTTDMDQKMFKHPRVVYMLLGIVILALAIQQLMR